MGGTLCSTAQTSVFKGQLWSNNSPVKSYTVLVDGHSSTTDDAGVFSVPIANKTTQVSIQIPDRRFVILYPVGGKGLIPKDPALITQIIVEPFQSNKYIDIYLAGIKGLRDSSGKSQAELKGIHSQIDSVTKLLYKFNYTNNDLSNARERQDGMDLFYPQISTTLQNYVNQARNIASAFKYTATYAFDNHIALDQLAQAVNSYNPAYTQLYNNYQVYSQKIGAYWQNDKLKTTFDGITDTLINVIHLKTIYPLNDIKTSINQYFSGEMNGKDKAATKKSIQDQIALIVPKLIDDIDKIEQHIQEFQNQLKKQ